MDRAAEYKRALEKYLKELKKIKEDLDFYCTKSKVLKNFIKLKI